MNILNWITGHFSNRGKALSLYRRGMVRAQKHDHQGAIDDYTEVIDTPDAPADVKAMARYNRALVYSAAGDDTKAAEELQLVLAMTETLSHVKSEARRKLVRMQRQASKSEV